MRNKSLLMTIAILIIAMSAKAQQTGTFTDSRDGKTYKTVKIGTQTWMAENLSYDKNAVYYNNIKSSTDVLYNVKIAQDLCPQGWQLPSIEDIILLAKQYNGVPKIDSLDGFGIKTISSVTFTGLNFDDFVKDLNIVYSGLKQWDEFQDINNVAYLALSDGFRLDGDDYYELFINKTKKTIEIFWIAGNGPSTVLDVYNCTSVRCIKND